MCVYLIVLSHVVTYHLDARFPEHGKVEIMLSVMPDKVFTGMFKHKSTWDVEDLQSYFLAICKPKELTALLLYLGALCKYS